MAVYATLTILSSWNEVLAGLGLATLVTKEAATLVATQQTEKVRRLISSVLVYRSISMFVLCLIWILLGSTGNWDFINSDDYTGLVGIVIWTSFVMSCRSTVSNIQVSVQKFGTREVINIVTILAQRSFCVTGFLVYGVIGFYWGFLLATLIGLGLGLFDIRRYLTNRLVPFTQIFKKSRSFLGLKILRSGLDHLDRPVIAIFMGAESLAGYHVAKRLFENFYGLILAVVIPAGVKFGELRSAEPPILKEYYRKCVIFIAYIFIPLGFFMAVIGTPLLYLYGGDKYLPNATIVMCFGFTLMCIALWIFLREVALRLLAPKHLAYQYALSNAVTLSAYCVLLPTVGMVGIPVSMGLGYLAGLFIILMNLEKQCELTVPLHYIYMALGAGVCVLTTAIPLRMLDSYVAQLVLGTVLSGLVYLAWITIVGPVEARGVLRRLNLRIRGLITVKVVRNKPF